MGLRGACCSVRDELVGFLRRVVFGSTSDMGLEGSDLMQVHNAGCWVHTTGCWVLSVLLGAGCTLLVAGCCAAGRWPSVLLGAGC